MKTRKASTPSGAKYFSIEKIVQNQLLHSEELEPFMALYQQDAVQKREVAIYSRLKDMYRWYAEHNEGRIISRNRSLQGAAARKGKPKRKSQRQMERIQVKTENVEIVLNGPRKTCVLEEIRAVSSTIETKRD